MQCATGRSLRPALNHFCSSPSRAPLADLPFGNNPLFAVSGLSPSPGLQNPVFSPATVGGGGAPASAAGLRRLGFLPQSQLGAASRQWTVGPSPGSDEAMAEGDEAEGAGPMEDGEQPPAASLAIASPGAAAAGGGSRERPEEEEFASVLGAGGLACCAAASAASPLSWLPALPMSPCAYLLLKRPPLNPPPPAPPQ